MIEMEAVTNNALLVSYNDNYFILMVMVNGTVLTVNNQISNQKKNTSMEIAMNFN